MARRKPKSNPVSLFAFQDIITSTTGVLILLALILMLALATKEPIVEQPTRAATKEQFEKLAGLTNELKQLNEGKLELNISRLVSSTPSELKSQLDAVEAEIKRLESAGVERKRAIAIAAAKVKSDSKNDSDTGKAQQLSEAIDAVEAETASLKNSNRVVYNFRNLDREPWLVQIDENELLAARAGSVDVQVFRTATAFTKFAKALPKKQQYVVMIVRPAGIAKYDELKKQLERLDFDLGTELIGENQVAVDPEKGAVF